MARMTVTEARLLATTGEIQDPEKVDTATVQKVADVLAGSDWRRVDNVTAYYCAMDELDFRKKYGY